MHSSFLPRAQSRHNNFVDHVADGTSQLNSVRSLDEVSQGGTDVRCLGASKRVNLGTRSAAFGATAASGVARLGASVPSAKSSNSVFQKAELACAPVAGQKMGINATTVASSSSSSSSSGPQVPYVMYIDGAPDLNPNLHFRTSLDVHDIMEAVENVFEEFQSTAYEWNRKHFMWRAFVTKSSCPTKCSVHVFSDPCSDEPMYWIEMRRLEGDGQDFFDLYERMQRSLAPDSFLVSEPSSSSPSVMQAPSSGLRRSNSGTRGLDKEKKAIFMRVLELSKSKHIIQRQHALQLICDTARQDSAACLIDMCEMGCAEVCLAELCADECNMNTQLAVTALHCLTRYPISCCVACSRLTANPHPLLFPLVGFPTALIAY